MTREMVELDSRQLSETESFLKRVEEYDSQRRSAAGSKPPLKQKPSRLKSSINEESLEKARRLLEGESPEELERLQSRRSTKDVTPSELAYKSAYNYEKSFSPPRSNYSLGQLGLEADASAQNSSRTFVISEEDFLLLQKLKSSKEKESDCEPVKKHLPSRGRPRGQEREPPSFPTRPARIKHDLEPPSKPVRPGRRDHDVEVPSYPKRSERREEIPVLDDDAPSLPARKYREKADKASKEPKEIEKVTKETPVPPPKRKGVILEETQKPARPPVPPKSRGTLDLKSSKENAKPATFVESLEKNKLTVVPQAGTPRAAKKLPASSHLDFVDSVHLSPKHESISPATPVKIGHHSSLENGSFIKSALKTTGSSPTNVNGLEKKPVLPRKPLKLQGLGAKHREDALGKDSQDDESYELKNAKLRTVDKPKPKVPAKKDTLVIPKLRPVTEPTKKSTEETAQLVSPRALKKVDVSADKKRDAAQPEALVKMGQLNRSVSPSRVAGRQNETPEALAKLGGLRKLKDAPPVPKRNISLPEALKKAERLRNTPDQRKNPSPARDFRDELNVVLRAPKSESVPQPTTANHKNDTDSISDASRESTPLVHPTKGRSRGPKRKLPTKVQ